MNTRMVLQRVGRYGAVGLAAAAVHAGILLLFSQWVSLSLANPIAFIAASLAGYVGRPCLGDLPGGDRWQTLCLPLAGPPIRGESECLRPAALNPWATGTTHPSYRRFGVHAHVLNALIWSRAARFSARHRTEGGTPPLLHADDLSLGAGVDHAIFDLVQAGRNDPGSIAMHHTPPVWAEP